MKISVDQGWEKVVSKQRSVPAPSVSSVLSDIFFSHPAVLSQCIYVCIGTAASFCKNRVTQFVEL